MSRVEKVSFDEMARDARTIVGGAGQDWATMFCKLLACYGWRVEREGGVIHKSREVILCDWEIVRAEPRL